MTVDHPSGDVAPERETVAAVGRPVGVLVLGANGPTGRLIVQQALERGLRVVALTRHPKVFPLRHDLLQVIAGDATDPTTIDNVVSRCDSIISVIGTAYTRAPVDVYSTSAGLLVAAMSRYDVTRLLVVTSAEVARESALQGRFLIDHVLYPLLRNIIGRTVYDDMERMEAIVSATGLDWTIVRPPGLTDLPGTGYTAEATRVAGMYCARGDLAKFLLDQLGDDRFLRHVAAVSSPALRVSVAQTIRREVFKR